MELENEVEYGRNTGDAWPRVVKQIHLIASFGMNLAGGKRLDLGMTGRMILMSPGQC